MGGVRQRPARRQPGPHLVDDGDHEDRPRRPGQARPGDGPQRGRRLRRRRDHRPRHRLHRRTARAAAGAVLPRSRLRRPRPRHLGAVRPRDPRPCPPRSRQPRHHRRRPSRPAHDRRDLHPHLVPREGAVVVLTGRARQQPQRRPRLGTVPDLLRRRRALRRPDRRARCDLPRRVGARPTRHRCAVGSDRPQTVDRRRDAHPSRGDRPDRRHHRVLGVGRRCRPARRRHRDGLSHPPRRHR